MKQQYLLPSLFFFLLLVPSASFVYADEEKYQDESFGYSMNVPEGYLIATPFNDVTIISSEKTNQANGVDSINVLVTRHDGKPLPEMMELVRNDLENFGNEITDETQIKIGSDSGDDSDNDNTAVLIKSYGDNGFPVFYESVIVYHKNLAYFLTVTYTDSDTQETFEEMLESFEFAEDDEFIPQWIKHVSAKWSEGIASDEDFANAMRYMLIMFPVSETTTTTTTTNDYVDNDDSNNVADSVNDDVDRITAFPYWIKGIASSWSQGDIDNKTWKNMLQYLHEKEILIL